ncbi:MAG: ferritin [Opitutales bacterium TMED158]|nr:MAG: ferritin [Opitutales bacterium TMED158]
MDISSELEVALNEQIGVEFTASHAYLSMAAYFERNAFDGFAQWMHLQSEEERMHAMKFYQYLNDRGGVARLPEIEAPRWDFDSVRDVFETSLSQEQTVTEHIYSLYKVAQDESDFATVSFLKWFVDEQVEEEKNVSDMIDKLKMAEGNPESLLLLDRYALERKSSDSE